MTWKEKLKKSLDKPWSTDSWSNTTKREIIEYFISTEIIEKLINDLESNPNLNHQQSPNIAHWIESKQRQLRQKWLPKS